MRYLCLAFCLSCLFPANGSAQSGCTDPQANNFDPLATENDGSCLYPNTNYSLITKTGLADAVRESSGLTMAAGMLWTHNDSGNAPALYQIDTLTNAIIRTVTIGGASNVDWEDLAFDGLNFYIGDFGNNANGNRTDLVIYKFPLSAIPAGPDVTVPSGAVEEIHFQYEDQTDFSPQGSNNTAFDCEAMVWWNDSLHLFTKDWVSLQTVHYTLPAKAGSYQAQRRETLAANTLVTGADISSAGVLSLLGYGINLSIWLLFDYQDHLFFNGNKRQISLGPFVFYGQAEGISFRDNGSGYISTEYLNTVFSGIPVMVPSRLYSFQISQWLQPEFLPATEAPAYAAPCRIVPNPLSAGQAFSLLYDLPSGARGEILDASGRCVWQGMFEKSDVPALTVGTYFIQMRNGEGLPVCRDVLMVR